MAGLLVLLHLGGAIALLLWATRMVRTGVERAYGRYLKARLRDVMRKPVFAILFGLFMAVVLQSSTAVTLLVSSFVGAGFVTGAAGLMAVRGGELGSALVVKILSLDLSALVPLLLITGTVVFMTTERREWRQLGRIIVGVALLILSLEMTGNATAPLRDSEALPAIISYLASDPVSSFLIAAVITYIFHSSIAGIILIASFATHGLIGTQLGVIMVLGVNFGSSLIAPLLTRNAPPETRVVALGNLLMRGAGSLLMLALILLAHPPLGLLGTDAASSVINAHIIFNLIIMICGIPLSKPVLKLTEKFVRLQTTVPSTPDKSYPFSQTALNPISRDKPTRALASATREAVHLADIIELMAEKTMELYSYPDKGGIDEVASLGKLLDQRQGELKLYLADLATGKLSPDETRQTQNLLDTCVKLQQTGAILSHTMLNGIRRLHSGKLILPKSDKTELIEFYAQVLTNARMAFNVLISGDIETAREIVHEKDRLRTLERSLRLRHFERMRDGGETDVATSTFYLDQLHELKQINGLLASLAYPVLEEQSMLKGSRLKK